MVRRVLLACLAMLALVPVLAVGLPGAAAAQDFGRVVSPILTLDRDALFARTLYGQRVNREIESASTAMAAETRSIEAALEAEELALTEQRATMEPEAFRALATAFDDKVQALRIEREAVEADFLAQIEAARSDFFARIGPVLGQLVRERGAVLIIDRRAVLLAAADIDITADAIERIDAVLGDGDTLGGGLTNGASRAPAPPPASPPTSDETSGETAGEPSGEAPDTAHDDSALPVDTIPAPGTAREN